MSFSLLLTRVVLPAALLISIVLRPFGLSIFYLLLFLLLPLLESLEKKPGFCGNIFILPTLLSFGLVGVHIAWHVTLAAFSPYGSLLTEYPTLEKVGLNLGLVSYKEIPTPMAIQYVAPELIVFVASLLIYLVINKIPQSKSSKEKAKNKKYQQWPLLTNVAKYLCLFLLMLSGSALPSVTSGIYFLVFLITATAWSLGADISRGLAVVSRCILFIMAFHMILLLVYQCTWLQEMYDDGQPFARYFGMRMLVNVTGSDYQSFQYEPTNDKKWLTLANPVVVLITYYILAIESRELFKRKVAYSYISSKALRGNTNESIPLIRNFTSKKASSFRNALQPLRQDSTGSVLMEYDSVETAEKTHLDAFIAGLSDFCQLLVRSSYIATTIVMMAWSIMYHSWLTFVLLMWACIVWLCSNQRSVMLKSSPVLVVYAMMLVLVQYIYCMDLTEAELPSNVTHFNLKQIGVSRPEGIPGVTLIIKSMFMCVFWLTLRQRVTEIRQQRRAAAAADISGPLQVTVSTATTGMAGKPGEEQNRFLAVVGKHVNALCARYWIYVVVIMLFIIGLTGNRMTIFRIIYMFLFLAFILMFQISWKWWRKLMYMFWIIVIIYSMINLILLYVYQFDNFSRQLEDYLHINKKLQNDLGLEPYDPADLFVKLLTPTLFLISTILQVHYFHKDFMALSDPQASFRTSVYQGSDSSRHSPTGTSTMKDMPPLHSEEVKLPPTSPEDMRSTPLTSAELKSPPHSAEARHVELTDDSTSAGVSSIKARKYRRRPSRRKASETQSLTFKRWLLKNFYIYRVIASIWINKLFMFLDLHLVKIIMFSLMLLCVTEVCAMHTPIMLLISPTLLLHTRHQKFIILFISILISLYFMARMVYQIDYILHDNFNVQCSGFNKNTDEISPPPITFNNAQWIGFVKKSLGKPLVAVVRGYIGVMSLITFWSIVRYRQQNIREQGILPEGTDKIMFPNIKREDADINLKNCIKFLFNYGFYKFGVELTLITLMITIGSRMDMYAVIYVGWLFVLVSVNRKKQARIWRVFTFFLIIIVPFQYILSVGIIPELCPHYPWDSASQQMKHVRKWFFLPDMVEPPNATKLIFDYLLLMFASRQLKVFAIERRYKETYPGGSNSQEHNANWETPEFVNPVPDFLGTINTWLDFVKRVIFMSMLWVTLAIMFLTGTNRVNLFSIGYLVGSFIFLWQGTDFYLLPKTSILRWWSWLLFYNVSVVSLKTLLQIPGCMFGEEMQANACWLVQLLGIGCVDKFGGNFAHFIRMNYVKYTTCSVPQEDIGLAWDGVCFAFLLLQRRLFHSYYFYRIIDESKATTILASRGAELIEELRQKQMLLQEDQEQKILEKIKLKMERIKANQKKIHGVLVKDPRHHDEEDDDTQNMDTSAGARGFHTPESAATPRGYHTPLSERSASPGGSAGGSRGESPPPPASAAPPPVAPLPPAAPPGGPPSPSSALMTASLSLDAYLEPRRISFESPPSSELVPRAQSPEDSYPVFSPPPIRRRTSFAPTALRRASTSVISQSSRVEPKSHHTSIHSGDYYMFDDEFDDTEVQIGEEESESKLDKDAPQEMGFGALLATALKTDLRRAVSARRFSSPEEHLQQTESASTSMHQTPQQHKEGGTSGQEVGTSGQEGGTSEPTEFDLKDPELITKVDRIRETLWALFASILTSITKYMMKFSRDYRYVSNTLSIEKKVIKEKPGFGIGVRGGPQMRWEPLPEAFRKLSEISVPEIRILAPSMERGLDDSPAPRRHSPSLKIPFDDDEDGTSEHESAFSLQSTSSHDVTTLEEQDDSVFRRGKNPLIHLAYAIWFAVLSHTEIVCYLMVFVNQIQSATILSIPLPLMVFVWGTLSIPRPTKTFWVTLIAYTEVIVLIKSMFQFEMLPWNQKAIPANMPFSAPRVIGIERKPGYAVYDLLLLLFIFFHRYMLKSLGLWKESMPDTELRADAEYPLTPEDARMLVEGQLEMLGRKYIQLHDESGPHHPMIDRLYYVRAAMENVARELNVRWSDPRVAILVHQQLVTNKQYLDRFKREEMADNAKAGSPRSSRQSDVVLLKKMRGAAAAGSPSHMGMSSTGAVAGAGAGARGVDSPAPGEGGTPTHRRAAPLPQGATTTQDEAVPTSSSALEGASSAQEGGPPAQEGEAPAQTNGAPAPGGGPHRSDLPGSHSPSHVSLSKISERINVHDDNYQVHDEDEPIIAVTSTLEDVYNNYPGVIMLSVKRYFLPTKQFFRRMLQPGSRVKVDVYAYMFMCDFINFLVVIFGFAAFGTHQGDGGVQAYLEENKVPIPFLVMLILQFVLIIIDRALYLRKFMLGKILFQYALIIGVHIWMFFVLPFITERMFSVMAAPPTWYIVKCVYLLLSAYQIRSGYPRRIIGNFLCKSYSFVNQVLFRGFMAVPFVFELRTLMDWIWTDTSMTLMDWLKMEDIFASVYLLKCSRYLEDEFPQPRGENKSATSKYLLGGGVLAFVIAIIWFPLVFFAFGNTVGQPNPPTDVTAKIRIGPFLPVYMMSAQSHNIAMFTEGDYNQLINLYARDRTAQTFLSNYMHNDVAVVTLNSYSTLKWEISPPELERLEKEANSSTPLLVKFTFVVTHKTNAQNNPPVFEESREVLLEAELPNGTRNAQRDKLYQLLTDTAPPDTWIEVPMLFPKFVKVFNKGSAKPAYQLVPEGADGAEGPSRFYRGVMLRLERAKDDLFWRVKENCDSKDIIKTIPMNDCDMLVMYTFNDKLFPDTLNFISGSGIIGLYTTFVFLASRVIRGFFSGIYTRIMFDDLPNVDRVLQLCLDIYLVREALELTLEEDLFAKLVFLYRSPETMIKWSRPKDEASAPSPAPRDNQ